MRKIILAMLTVCVSSLLAYAESCSSVGATEKKYTPQDDCDYKTETRTCCEDGEWSDWDKACIKKCTLETKIQKLGGYGTQKACQEYADYIYSSFSGLGQYGRITNCDASNTRQKCIVSACYYEVIDYGTPKAHAEYFFDLTCDYCGCKQKQ